MKNLNKEDTILFGIGNSGRQDDGLGWAFLEEVERDKQFIGQVHYRYQLQVEDAALVSEAGKVVFIDAYKGELDGGIKWEPCKPGAHFAFSTHELDLRSVLYLSNDLYDKLPEAYLLAIQGYEWELQTGLTPLAKENLKMALDHFYHLI